MKLIPICIVLGYTLACLYDLQLQLALIGAAFLFGWFIGECTADQRPTILKPHDESSFTSSELRKIGIIPPEHYDTWLEERARR